MHRAFIFILLSIVLIIGNSCRTCNCIDGDISFHFAGFQPSELQRIIIKQYGKGGNFTRLTDSSVNINASDYRLEIKGDSTYLNPSNGRLKFNKMSDWLVELPEAGRSFRITEIEMAQVRDQCNGKTICVNPVRSLRVDGRELQGPIQGLLGITLRK